MRTEFPGHREGDNFPLTFWLQQTNPKQRVAKGSQMVLKPEPWNPDIKVYWDPFGQRVVSMAVAEMKPGGKSTMHRQLNEASMFILSGQGYTIAGGEKYEWGPGDLLQVPLFLWHQHFNPGKEPVRYIRHGTVPFSKYLGLYKEEKLEPPKDGKHNPRYHDEPLGTVKLLHRSQWMPQGKLDTFGVEGHHATFAEDIGIGHKFGGGFGASRVVPGKTSALHRHWNEAIIYILEGKGYSTINEERYDWEAGDMLCVPLLFWHRHHALGDKEAIYLRHTNTPLPQYLGIWMMNLYRTFPEADIPKLKGNFPAY